MTSSAFRKHFKTIDDKQKSFNDYKKCNETFGSKSNLKFDVKTYLGPKPLDKKFAKSSYLKNHLKRHLGLKPFKCHFEKCVEEFYI